MTTTRRFMCGLAAVAAALLAPAAPAQTTAPPQGRLLASNCFQCHGTDGRRGFEQINGKSQTEIYSKLKEMQSKQPGTEDYGIMIPHAKGYTDAQLRLIADYFATRR